MSTRLPGPVLIDGHLSATSMSIPANTIDDSDVKSDAGIDPSKMGHEHRPTYSQEAAADAAAGTYGIHKARAAGTVQAFEVWLVTPPDTASGSDGKTAIVDLLKNGVSILSAAVTLDSTNTAYVSENGTLASAAYVAGDVFSVSVTLGAGATGTAPKGVAAALTVHEDPA